MRTSIFYIPLYVLIYFYASCLNRGFLTTSWFNFSRTEIQAYYRGEKFHLDYRSYKRIIPYEIKGRSMYGLESYIDVRFCDTDHVFSPDYLKTNVQITIESGCKHYCGKTLN